MSYKEIFRNQHFVVVDKAAGILSVPGRDQSDGRPVLGKILESDYQQQIFPVHRLDLEVQGLIMYAFTMEAHRSANAWFEKKEIQKTYSALTFPVDNEHMRAREELPTGEKFSWKCKLLRGKKRAYESPAGKESLTLAEIVKVENGIFHWELNPVTGRSHQLRYELFRHGHPILRDFLYGADHEASEKFKEEGIALRAFRLDFRKAPRARDFQLPELIETSVLSI